MTPYDMIKAQLGQSVPFARHAGVVLTDVGEGEGAAELAQSETTVNHIGTQHAGALFTLGETASGAAMAGAFAPVILSVRPVAANASIAYKKVAKGLIKANARIEGSPDELLARLEAEGRVSFDVRVSLVNEAGEEVAEMTVAWNLKKI